MMGSVRSDAASAVLLLTSRLVGTPARPLRASEFWPLLHALSNPGVLLTDGVEALPPGVDRDRVAALLERRAPLALALEELEHRGIAVLTPFDENWPVRLTERLGATAPPTLHVAGDPTLLAADGLGVVGSRNVDRDGAAVARAVGALAAANGFPLVSGGARGVDRLAMDAAVEADGTSVGVLADALERVVRQAETRRLVIDGRLCLVTPYLPSAGFTAGNAMARNKIIYALSRVTLVVASNDGSGGTWSGADEALRRGYGRVAVWRGLGEGSGNATLVFRGGAPVTNVADVLAAPAERPDVAGIGESPTQQLSLEL